jgi:hypothetical protein
MISCVILKKYFKEDASIRGNTGDVHGEMLKQNAEKKTILGRTLHLLPRNMTYHEIG